MIQIKANWHNAKYDFYLIKNKILSYTNKKNKLTIKINKKNIINITNKIKRILQYIEDHIDNILIGTPSDLREHINNIQNIDSHVYKGGKKASDINRLLSHIFKDMCYNSSNLDKKDIVFNKFEFTTSLNINTCPYCNRNYIYTTSPNKLKNEIDHFFPTTHYPYLAVSFHNLIPSCKFCNQISIKGSYDTHKNNVKNPYEIQDKDFKFTYFIQSIDLTQKRTYSNSKCLELENLVNIQFKRSIPSNLDCFKLEELYQKHSDIVMELICKKMHYPKTYIQDLVKLGFSKEEIHRFLFCNYLKKDELHKRPLSKLIKDISEELHLIL